MKRTRRDKDFVKKPYYLGGIRAMRKFIDAHRRYPQEALSSRIEGSVQVRYTIDHKGKVVDTKVIAGIGSGCDEEAQRIVRLLTFEVPKTHKVRVLFHKTIRIHFRLPKKTPPGKQSVRYEMTTKKKKEIRDESRTSYYYKINW